MGAAPFLLKPGRMVLAKSIALVAHATPVVSGTLGEASRAIRKLDEENNLAAPIS
jgi:hypothetical protein